MKFEKKAITVLLVAAIGLSLFVGYASALGENPVTQILQILLGINDKLDNSTQMLRYYENWYVYEVSGSREVRIDTDKPALFTVSIEVHGLTEEFDEVFLWLV